MRATSDGIANFGYAVEILMQIESAYDLEIPDSTLQQINAWEDMTIRDLIAAVRRHLPTAAAVDNFRAEELVLSAVKAEYPNAPNSLRYDVRLIEAISPQRDYGGSYS